MDGLLNIVICCESLKQKIKSTRVKENKKRINCSEVTSDYSSDKRKGLRNLVRFSKHSIKLRGTGLFIEIV